MVPTTDDVTESRSSIEQFYDELSSDYDLMTGFTNRFKKERPYFRLLIEQHKIKTILDAGSGTGFHALLLAQLGAEVTAVDVSSKMLAQLQAHSDQLALSLRTIQTNFEALDQVVNETFDAVMCMGNSVAHLLTLKQLLSTFKNFHKLLKPNGLLMVQTLNYERIMKQRQRIQNVRKVGNKLFVRFYDFLDSALLFNILTLASTDEKVRHSLQTIELRPVYRREVEALLKETGFSSIRCFGGSTMDEYDPETSQDVFILAVK